MKCRSVILYFALLISKDPPLFAHDKIDRLTMKNGDYYDM